MIMSQFINFNRALLNTSSQSNKNGFNLLLENRSLFVDDLYYMTDSSTHTNIHIETEDDKLVQENTYLFPNEAYLFESKLRNLIERGFVVPSNSEWSSPVMAHIVKDRVEFSIDFTKLNEMTKKFDFKVPEKSNLVSQITESCFFSKLVIKDAIKQLRLDKESSSKTAFTTDYGFRYQFKTMAPGLKYASEHLQCEMERFILGFLNSDLINQERVECCRKSIKIYLDTIFVHTKTLVGHTSTLAYVFGRLKYFNMKLDRFRSQFFEQEINFLGRSISSLGISICPEEKISILSKNYPSDLNELKSFIDSVYEYNLHIDNYNYLIQPLLDLEEYNMFEWTDRESTAFQNLKTAVRTAKPLSFRPKEI